MNWLTKWVKRIKILSKNIHEFYKSIWNDKMKKSNVKKQWGFFVEIKISTRPKIFQISSINLQMLRCRAASVVF